MRITKHCQLSYRYMFQLRRQNDTVTFILSPTQSFFIIIDEDQKAWITYQMCITLRAMICTIMKKQHHVCYTCNICHYITEWCITAIVKPMYSVDPVEHLVILQLWCQNIEEKYNYWQKISRMLHYCLNIHSLKKETNNNFNYIYYALYTHVLYYPKALWPSKIFGHIVDHLNISA